MPSLGYTSPIVCFTFFDMTGTRIRKAVPIGVDYGHIHTDFHVSILMRGYIKTS